MTFILLAVEWIVIGINQESQESYLRHAELALFLLHLESGIMEVMEYFSEVADKFCRGPSHGQDIIKVWDDIRDALQ